MNKASERSTSDSIHASDEDDTTVRLWFEKNREHVTILVAAIIATGLSCMYYLSTMLS
jgi:hypothetical protein